VIKFHIKEKLPTRIDDTLYNHTNNKISSVDKQSCIAMLRMACITTTPKQQRLKPLTVRAAKLTSTAVSWVKKKTRLFDTASSDLRLTIECKLNVLIKQEVFIMCLLLHCLPFDSIVFKFTTQEIKIESYSKSCDVRLWTSSVLVQPVTSFSNVIVS